MEYYNRIKELKRKGLSYRKIAAELGISLGKVQRLIRINTLGVSIQPDTPVSKRIDTPSLIRIDTDVENIKIVVKSLGERLDNIESNLQNEVTKLLESIGEAHLARLEAYIDLKLETLEGKQESKVEVRAKDLFTTGDKA